MQVLEPKGPVWALMVIGAPALLPDRPGNGTERTESETCLGLDGDLGTSINAQGSVSLEGRQHNHLPPHGEILQQRPGCLRSTQLLMQPWDDQKIRIDGQDHLHGAQNLSASRKGTLLLLVLPWDHQEVRIGGQDHVHAAQH